MVIDKPMRSAFQWTDLDLILRNKDVKNLVVSLSLSVYTNHSLDFAIRFCLCRVI
jgi:hypothetical protein